MWSLNKFHYHCIFKHPQQLLLRDKSLDDPWGTSPSRPLRPSTPAVVTVFLTVGSASQECVLPACLKNREYF